MHQTFGKLPDYDAETDQYNTLNRHYSPSGRWLSPDPGGVKVVKLDDPQTWNMYAYVRNNPTNLTDPTGLEHDAPPALTCSDGQPGCVNGLVGGAVSSTKEGPTQKLSWESLSDLQRGALAGGVTTWNGMNPTAQANFAAITHALEKVILGNGATGLSEIVPGSASMRSNGREMDVTWQNGAAEAFKKAGFVNRVGSPWDHPGESGLIKVPSHGGHGNIQGIHVLFNKKDSTKGDVHIDYLWGICHFCSRNDDVRQNYATYKEWYGEISGDTQ
jgi:RHS repeat-associated protein